MGRESVLITRNRRGEAIRPSSTSAATAAPSCAPRSPGEAQRAFQCPYHAWTYDFDGKLIAAPNLTKMPDIDRVEYGLVTVARP